MTDYKSLHPGSTSVSFVSILLKHEKLIALKQTLKQTAGRIAVLDFGCGEGNFAVALNSPVFRKLIGVDFYGLELDSSLYERSLMRIDALDDPRLNIRLADFCCLPDELIESLFNYEKIFIYINNDNHRMSDSTTNDLSKSTECRLVRSLLIYPVGTVLISLGLLPIIDDWKLDHFCISTRHIEPLSYDPGRDEMKVYRYEKVSTAMDARRHTRLGIL